MVVVEVVVVEGGLIEFRCGDVVGILVCLHFYEHVRLPISSRERMILLRERARYLEGAMKWN